MAVICVGCAHRFASPCEFRSPYNFCDISDTLRVGGDFIQVVAYPSGAQKSQTLKPPILLYPPDRAVFCHFPREIVHRWQPAKGSTEQARYLFQYVFTTGQEEQFGDWSNHPAPAEAYLTGKTNLNERFVGSQPGRWRVKAVDETGESEWSEWRYFRFIDCDERAGSR